MQSLVSYDEAANILGVSKGTLYAWVSKRKIAHYRLGPRLVRFSPEVLHDFIKNSRENPIEVVPAQPAKGKKSRSKSY